MRELKLPFCKLKLAPPKANLMRRGRKLHRGYEFAISLPVELNSFSSGYPLVDKKRTLADCECLLSDVQAGGESQLVACSLLSLTGGPFFLNQAQR